MGYLFLFHIGPVQSFIASARRTRDLWFGSQLLSDLSWTAADVIAKAYGPQALIFPSFLVDEQSSPSNEQGSFSDERNVSNKIVALLEPQESAAAFATMVQQAVVARLNAIRDLLYSELRDANAKFDEDVMNAQLADCLEFFWVALPFAEDGTSGDYAYVRKQLEALMAARKATYTYRPVTWGKIPEGAKQPRHKSSITGVLESVIQEEHYNRKQNNIKQEPRLFRHFRAGPAEYLSGIDLLKRRGKFPDASLSHAFFLSTSHVAAQSYINRLHLLPDATMHQVRDAWEQYYRHIMSALPVLEHEKIPTQAYYTVVDQAGNVIIDHSNNVAIRVREPVLELADGALLFAEHLIEPANKNTDILRDAGARLKAFKDAVETAIRAADKETVEEQFEPDPYYAIVVADGDRIGETIDKLAQKGPGGALGYQKHQEFSSQLAKFASEAKRIVKELQGTPIYAGGDDVLALVPLHTLLTCTTELAKKFSETLAPVMQDQKETPTLSIGVAIVHHLSLLQDSLELARSAERSAKSVKGKNALAILLCKRGGEQVLVKGPREEITPRLRRYIEYYRAGVIPSGMPYELRSMYQLLLPIEQKLSDNLKEVVWSNTKRILKRKLELPGSKVRQVSAKPGVDDGREKERQDRLAREILRELLRPIEGRPEQDPLFVQKSSDSDARPIPLPEFMNELIVAKDLADALQLAIGGRVVLQPAADEGIRA